MKEKVLSLAKGNFTYEKPELRVNPQQLTGKVSAGGSLKCVMTVENSRGTKVKGFGSTMDPEVHFLPVFHGVHNELEVEFDAGSREPGQELVGTVSIVTDCGEVEIPYQIKVVREVIQTTSGVKVDDYYHLQRLLRENMEEGLEAFRSPRFKEVFLQRDEMGRILYDHLTRKNSKSQGVEEFLAAMGKKEAVSFTAVHMASGSKKEIGYQLDGADVRDALEIRINNPGSIRIRVEASADFIELDKQVLDTGEFDGHKTVLEYTIRMDKVPQGIRRGTIKIQSIYQSQEIQVEAHNVILASERKLLRAKQQAWGILYRSHLAYKEGRMERAEYQQMLQKNKAVIVKLFPEHVLEVTGYIAVLQRDEREILEFYQKTEGMPMPDVTAGIEEVERYLLIQYIKYLYTKREDDKNQVSALIQEYNKNGFDSLLMFIMGTQVHERYQVLQWLAEDVKKKLDQGSRCAYLYSLLMQCYDKDPSLLMELDKTVLAVLRYGQRTSLLTQELAVNISFLAQRVQDFDLLTYTVMKDVYEDYAIKDALISICEMVIRGEKRQHKYFTWMEKGVKEHLRLTDLYEYYMYTMDENAMFHLPEAVLSYFQYENHLTDRCKAFLYSYILRKRDQYPEYYNLYEKGIFQYAKEQLARHRITKDLGVIYSYMLQAEPWNEETARDLPYVMFTEQLTCDNEKMESVVVVHREMKDEILYPIRDGKAKIQVFTPDVAFLFVDREGHYHCGTVGYTREKMLPLQDASQTLCQLGADHYGLLSHMAAKALRTPKLNDLQAEVLRYVLEKGFFRSYSAARIWQCLFDFYKKQNDIASLLGLLDEYDIQSGKKERAGEVAAACVYHGMYEKAQQILSRFGQSGCDKEALLMLVKERIAGEKGAYVPQVLQWCHTLYQERCMDADVLLYRMKYYMGSTKELTVLYEKCMSVPGLVLDDGCKERLLGQVLFTDTDPSYYEPLFHEYYEKGKNRVLVKAFLSYYAYEYLVDRIDLSEALAEKIEKEAMYVKEDVMVFAWLKAMSGAKRLSDRQKEFVELCLEKYAGEGRIFRFMQDFSGKAEVPYEVENAQIVQHFGASGQSVMLHVVEQEKEVLVIPMKQIFDGIYSAALLLFEGEEKQCYVKEEGTGRKSDIIVLRYHGTRKGNDSFFQMINEMQRLLGEGQKDAYEKAMKEFQTRREAAGKLFVIQ